ncbi:hypothetical protein BJX64DRAFT_268792 [Aspergillus heterothallicus]
MAVAPLESSSTPPNITSTDTTRSPGDSMEETDPQSTRKRPRLDSGSGVCDSLSVVNETAAAIPKYTPDAPAVTDEEAPVLNRPASRMTINMKSPTTPPTPKTPDTPTPTSEQSLTEESNPAASGRPIGEQPANVVSPSSSPAQSPEIEVAELEDMGQDPNTTSWKPLGEALREHSIADVVQLRTPEPVDLPSLFPSLSEDRDPRENLAEIYLTIEKESQYDTAILSEVKRWFSDVVNSLEHLTPDTFMESRYFWDEVPIVLENLLRRVEPFHLDDIPGFWKCLEEFSVDYIRLAFHLIHMDTLFMRQLVDQSDLSAPDLMSRHYIPALKWSLSLDKTPFFKIMRTKYRFEDSNMVVRLIDQITLTSLNAPQYLSEYATCLTEFIPRNPHLSPVLLGVLSIVHILAESATDLHDPLFESAVHNQAMNTLYNLVRSVDEQYQADIVKKSPWVSIETSPQILHDMSSTYLALCHCGGEFALGITKDLSVDAPEGIELKDLACIVYRGWRFNVLRKHIMDGRMELRVLGIETMQADFVNAFNAYMQPDTIAGIAHPLVQFLVKILRESKIIDYIVGVDSHPQLISRGYNVLGFLVITQAYTDSDTDTIWKTVTDSPDPRTVSEVLGMVQKTLNIGLSDPSRLHTYCSKMLELPLIRFDGRMIEFCHSVFLHLIESYNDRENRFGTMYIDIRPLRLCVRLIRESAASEELAADHKAHLQKFAAAKLASLMEIGLSDADKMDIYERCVQDVAERNQFSIGSIQALNALLSRDSREIRKLATEFNLTQLLILDLAEVVDGSRPDAVDTFLWNGFFPRVQMLSRIIDEAPESITPELGDILWHKIFMTRLLPQPGRRTLWEMLCNLTVNSGKENLFIDQCIDHYLPRLSPPADYFPEVLSFAKTTLNYRMRFSPPPEVGENDVVTIPGMDRIWSFILTAPQNSIEADAIAFAIEMYLDHNIIRRSPRSAVEATHISLVDRCVDQLKLAADNIKSRPTERINDAESPMSMEPRFEDVGSDELKFSRSLFFLRQFLQALRTRPQYSPPQHSPPNLPINPLKGDLVDIRYQAFDGGSSSKVRSLQIGDLSTASELVEFLVKVTGFPKLMTIFAGQRVDLLDKPDQTLRDLRLATGLLIVRRDPSFRGSAGRRIQALTPVDTEVLKHFDDLYELLNLDDNLAREIFDFLVVFPPQERVINLVKSTEQTAETMFPITKPYSLLYSVNALTDCLRVEALEPSPNESFIFHSIKVIVAALTRPQILESLRVSPAHIQVAMNLTECLYNALLVKPPVAGDVLQIPDSAALVGRILCLMNAGRNFSPTHILETSRYKLIWYTFAIIIEGSVRDSSFWTTVKQQVEFEELVFSLLIEERRQNVRKGVADHISLVCDPSRQLKKFKLPASETQEARATAISENPSRIDILATIWDAFVLTFPRVLDFPDQSQEFFEIAHSVFSSIAERSPHDMVFSDYIKQWSDIMLGHKTEEFVGREPVDHPLYGFSRLLSSCLEIAKSSEIKINTFNLVEQIFDKYLFPDLSPEAESPSELLTPRIPVMHAQTRQELYHMARLLSHDDNNYDHLIARLEDIIPEDQTYQYGWCFDRQRLIRSPEGYAGLRNLSNTCYLNSLLSQLFMNVEFREFMLGLDLPDGYTTQRLLDETKKVFAYMQESWLKSVDPEEFVDQIRTYENEPVDVTIQMDVDEFYNLLFDRWEAQIRDVDDRKRFRSFYGGQLVQQIKSKECSHISERLEPFSAIQCDIKGKASLEESLQAYVEGEIMQGDNKYSCTSCGRHVDAVKRACLKDVPDNLIFHLKRFDFDMVTMMRSKINDEFQFPERINMSPFTVDYLSDSNEHIKEDVFELVGVLVHSGTAESGHYYSYIRERPTAGGSSTWVEFNDADVSRFDPRRIGEQCFGGLSESLHSASGGHVRYNKAWNAYMLFYQRVSSMDAARLRYLSETNQSPVRAPLPVSLANHLVMDNELFIRTYCLLDPYYAHFVGHLFKQLNKAKLANSAKGGMLIQSMVFIALNAVEQLVTKSKETPQFDTLVAELYRLMNEIPEASYMVIEWAQKRSTGLTHLVKSPIPIVRATTVRLFVNALSKLRELYINAENATAKQMMEDRYFTSIEQIINALEEMWPSLLGLSRSWDDYFEFLLCIASFGNQEVAVILNHNFLVKCLEIVWLDQEDVKRLKRQYATYYKLLEKGRKFSHRKLMDFLAALLANIDLSVRPISDDEREELPNGKFSLSAIENTFIQPLGAKYELIFLRKILQQYSNARACGHIVALFMEAEPDAGLMDPIIKVLEDGLRVDPAERCAPFLEASEIVCRMCPDEDRIIALMDFVAKGVETIGNSGGREHLLFFTHMLASRNDRLGLDEKWFLSHVIQLVPEWAPWLLLYPDRAIRSMTMDALRRFFFNEETAGSNGEWQINHANIAKELVVACIDKLRRTYLVAAGINIQARVLDPIRTVIEHCLGTYFADDAEEEANIIRQAQMVLSSIEETTVELPEEIPSGKSAFFLASTPSSNP